jgi:prepilin-type N-terminal cleavage/methylation domain-containing protein
MRMAKTERGFTLVELMVASAIGLVVIMAMTSLFKLGMDATFTVTQRAETQQNMRAAIDLLTKDISLAGSGLPTGGLQLGTAALSKYACNQGGTCYLPKFTYPTNTGTGAPNYMYGILPGFSNGVENGVAIPNAPGQINDSITSIYCDYNFPLTNFTFTVNAGGTTVGVAPATPIVAGSPTNILQAGGLTTGDLLMFTVSTPGNGTGTTGNSLVQNAAVVAEITSVPSNTQIDFNTSDPLNFNQAAGSNNLSAVSAAITASLPAKAQTTVCRLYAVTYFIEVPTAGGTVQTPRLMRQVNGYNAVPVADNIINLQFSYDVINGSSTVSPNVADPIGAGLSPSLIQKVNMWVMGESLTLDGKRSQNMYLATSVSARNMSFCNSYSPSTNSCQ